MNNLYLPTEAPPSYNSHYITKNENDTRELQETGEYPFPVAQMTIITEVEQEHDRASRRTAAARIRERLSTKRCVSCICCCSILILIIIAALYAMNAATQENPIDKAIIPTYMIDVLLENDKNRTLDPKYHLPEGDFTNVTSLNLDSQLRHLQPIPAKWFVPLKDLKELSLRRNDISYLEPKLFHENNKLEEISLEHNQIESFHKDFFFHKYEVRILKLDFNRIKTLETTLFYSMRKLENLSLSNNLLTTISPEQFHQNMALKSLSLANNKLEELDFEVFRGLRLLEEVDIQGNELISVEDVTGSSDMTIIEKIGTESATSVQKFLNMLQTFLGID